MTDQNTRNLCALPQPDPFELPEGLGQPRAEAIRLIAQRWDIGSELTFHFMASPRWTWPEAQKNVVRNAFRTWADLGIGLSFREVPTAAGATLLIGRLQGDGSWSYLGTDVLTNRRNGCNMNFGWDLTTAWGQATALHEIGHALGMPHEHQNPNAGLVWDEAAVIKEYSGPPNRWKEEQIRFNILRKLPAAEVEGSNWDPRSVMHYPIESGLIMEPEAWRGGTPENFTLSAQDAEWVRRFYPPVAEAQPIRAGQTADLPRAAGALTQFSFEPTESRVYKVRTIGQSDARVTIFANGDDRLRPIAQADDAAHDDNARLELPLEAGRKYIISARTYYADENENVMLSVS